jgi:hypothetical protein
MKRRTGGNGAPAKVDLPLASSFPASSLVLQLSSFLIWYMYKPLLHSAATTTKPLIPNKLGTNPCFIAKQKIHKQINQKDEKSNTNMFIFGQNC